MSKVKVESKNANREIGVPRGARLTLWRAGAQPFDPAPRDLRMNRAAARFTSSASTEAARAGRRGSEYFFWAEEGAYGAQIGDAEDPEILILTADVAEGKFAVADADAAAGAIVDGFGDLVLKLVLSEVVAGAEGDIQSAAGQVAVADEGAHLIGAGFKVKIGRIELRRSGQIHDGKMGKSEKVFSVGIKFEQGADGGELAVAGIEIDDELSVEMFAGLETQVADNG